ncbi:LacI family DNA-binding transcriptional regulator [Mediterraneibacter sp. NSJ-55]|uniref:LacI family DNA-binding transcriptional regulator n=1 Tax=Mediterraneibacter hominis TaxID=2763054 RepID=A0A923RRC5_9FIRM|nr:LacI family DNA-binding transcriptional regulator [Mediterraneibacter hominis]MBC5690450.1 LacI family DNA-binding transcriptional regulator [Mediterraneibacter hominis]
MNGKKISVKDIAEMCNVSVATVSRVINQNGRFSQETEEKVKKVIEKYNFKPNQLAKGLRENKTKAVGIMVPDIGNEYFAKIILSLQTFLFSKGYSLVIYNTNESAEIEKQCVSYLVAQNVSGIIIVNSKTSVFKQLNKDIPTIYIDEYDRYTDVGNVAWLSSDHFQGGYLAAQELIDCKCRDLVVITALKESTVTKIRTNGFVAACEERGISLQKERIFSPSKVDFNEGKTIVKRIIGSGMHFDGIFCQTDWLAAGALEALLDKGIQVPDQVSLVGFDGISISQFGRMPITTIVQDTALIGKKAAKLVLRMIEEQKKTKKQHILVPINLVRRKTTRKK